MKLEDWMTSATMVAGLCLTAIWTGMVLAPLIWLARADIDAAEDRR